MSTYNLIPLSGMTAAWSYFWDGQSPFNPVSGDPPTSPLYPNADLWNTSSHSKGGVTIAYDPGSGDLTATIAFSDWIAANSTSGNPGGYPYVLFGYGTTEANNPVLALPVMISSLLSQKNLELSVSYAFNNPNTVPVDFAYDTFLTQNSNLNAGGTGAQIELEIDLYNNFGSSGNSSPPTATFQAPTWINGSLVSNYIWDVDVGPGGSGPDVFVTPDQSNAVHIGANATVGIYLADFLNVVNNPDVITAVNQLMGSQTFGTGSGEINPNSLWLDNFDLGSEFFPKSSSVSYSYSISSYALTDNPPALFDYNGGGAGDVLFENEQTGQLTFAEMNSTAGILSYAPATGNLPGLVYGGHGDVNGDGIADVVMQNPESGVIRVGYEDGKGDGKATFAQVADTPGFTVKGVADINGDGYADIVIQNSTTGVIDYYDVRNSRFVAITTAVGDAVVGVGDVNGDGDADVVLQNAATGQIEYADMAGGVFSGLVNVATTPGWDVRAVGDLNGDGDADIVIQNEASGQTLFADMHGGVFSGWGEATTGLTPDYAVDDAVDVNGDGYADVIVEQQSTGAIFTALEGPSGFTGWGTTTTSVGADTLVAGNGEVVPHEAALANDYTGSGTGSVLFQDTQTGQLTFAEMQAGVFQQFGAATAGLGNLVYGGSGDINGDGIADVVVQDPNSRAIYVGYETGSGNGVPNWADLPETPGGSVEGVGDINGDGYADIVIQNQSTGAVEYYDVHNATFVPVLASSSDKVVGVGDINGDGNADIVLQNSTGQIQYADMAGGVFSGLVNVATTPGWDVRAVGDLTGDGYADIVVQSQSTGQVLFADMKGGQFDDWGTATTGLTPDYVVEGAVDVLNNGHADLIVQQQSTGNTYYAQEGTNGFVQWGVVSTTVGTQLHAL